MKRQTFASVWDALEDNAAEAANMQARSKLMIAIRSKIESWNGSQTEAARRLGLTQPRLNDLMRGRIDKFSLDALVNLAGRAGLRGAAANSESRLSRDPMHGGFGARIADRLERLLDRRPQAADFSGRAANPWPPANAYRMAGAPRCAADDGVVGIG